MSQLFEPAGAPQEPPADQGSADITPRRSERRLERKAAKKKRRHRITSAVLIVVGLAVVAAGVYFIVLPLLKGGGGNESPAKVSDYPGPGSGSVQITIESGDSGQAIGQKLADADVVATSKAFVDAYRANPDATKIQAATYEMKQQMKASDAVVWLLNPKNQVQEKVLVKEGQRSWEIYQTISDVTGISLDEITAAAADAAAIGLPAEAKGDPEGWMFPATYTVQPGDDATAILKKMVQKTIEVLNKYGVAEGQREDVLIKASLVERETRRDEDRPKAARVIENRLAAGRKLEMDSTVAYITKSSSVWTTEQERAIEDPHNTYLYPGLPSGPICSPGEKAIEAVLKPADGTWMYFVTVNLETGETKFATTEEEFKQLKAEMQTNAADGSAGDSSTEPQ